MSKKNKRNHILIPPWAFLIFMSVLCEGLLHIWTMDSFVFGRFLAVIGLAAGLGGFLGLITSFLPVKAQKWVAMVLGFIIAFLCLLEYFLNDAYQNFMTISMVLDGAGGVAADFFDIVVTMLFRNLWRIILCLLPIVLYGIFARTRKMYWLRKVILGASTVLIYALCVSVVLTVNIDVERVTTAYDFDSAVHAFGVHAGMMLDVFKGSGGADDEPEFVLPVQTDPTAPPVETTAPNTVPNTEPTAPSETEETTVPTEPPVVFGPQVFPLDFASLAEQTSKSSVAKLHTYVASQTPSMENAYTGLFEGKNLILITAEAFSAEVIDPELTPTLYRLANKGIKFTDYYQPAWGASTTGGEYSNIIGLVPPASTSCMDKITAQKPFLTMGNQLQALGYNSAAFHNHSYTYYNRDSTHTKLGYDIFMGIGNGMEKGVDYKWPSSDLEMFEYTIPQYIDKQPFSLYYMTVSGHCLYSRKGNNMCKKNYDEVAHLDCSETVKCYYAANLELEKGLTVLVQQLEDAGIADDTVIVLATDHYPYGLEKSSAWGNDKDYLAELYGQKVKDNFIQDHSALIIWSGCLEDQDIVIDTPVYSLDILPTLSNLFNVDYDSRLLIGRDVFSETEPLVLWPDYSWKTDKGKYNASTRKFTPNEGVTVDEDYVSRINTIVKNKITYSKSVVSTKYFNYVLDALNDLEV